MFDSCSDFLEPKSPSEYIPKTADALNEMLLGDAYARADNSYFIFSYHNILDDDVEMTNEPINYKMSIDGFAALLICMKWGFLLMCGLITIA